MLFSVARLRRYASAAAFACFALPQFTSARDEVLFTSSVSYCAPPELILVQQFDIMYFAANQSVFFNISAASVENNINVTANLALNVYGSHSINVTIDLCSILNGALCPLPTYNFIGSETIPLSSLNLDLNSHIPGIAYKVPDLEAFAQLTLTTADTHELKACVQSTLSNGWSMRQLAVEWVTGGTALIALLSAILATTLLSPSSLSLAPQRLIDLLFLFQSIASSALLDLNYPVVYRAFATNFSWALGLFGSTNDASPIQRAIDNMRHHTGGDMTDATGDGVDLVNRKLSPYNVAIASSPDTVSAISNLKSKIALNQLHTTNNTSIVSSMASLAKRDTTVTVTDSNVLNAGIPVYVNSLGISTPNAFMTMFLTLLMLIAIVLAALGLGWLVVFLVVRRRERKGVELGRVREWRNGYVRFAKSWALRLTLIVFLPITIFALHQWTLKDSWLATLFSVLTLLFILACIIYPSFLTIRFARRSHPEALYEGQCHHRTSYGPLYEYYRPPRWWFFTLPIAILAIRAIVIAFGYASGIVQLIFILITEVFFLISLLVFRPHFTRGADVLSVTLSIGRILITALLFVFVESFGIDAIPRVAVGIAAAVVASLCVILMFFNVLVNFAICAIWLWKEHVGRRMGTRLGSNMWGRISPSASGGSRSGSGGGSAKGSVLGDVEKRSDEDLTARLRGGAGSGGSLANFASDIDIERPRNPTPHQHVPLDPEVNAPYPAITPTTASSHSHTSHNSKIFHHRNSDYRVSYASSQMPSTGTTFESFATSIPPSIPPSASSTGTESTLGTELPRRPAYEGLGLERLDYETTVSGSSEPSTPSTPHSNSQHGHERERSRSRVEGWTPSAALPRMLEANEN